MAEYPFRPQSIAIIGGGVSGLQALRALENLPQLQKIVPRPQPGVEFTNLVGWNPTRAPQCQKVNLMSQGFNSSKQSRSQTCRCFFFFKAPCYCWGPSRGRRSFAAGPVFPSFHCRFLMQLRKPGMTLLFSGPFWEVKWDWWCLAVELCGLWGTGQKRAVLGLSFWCLKTRFLVTGKGYFQVSVDQG